MTNTDAAAITALKAHAARIGAAIDKRPTALLTEAERQARRAQRAEQSALMEHAHLLAIPAEQRTASHLNRLAARRQALAGLRTYRSAALGVVTIPDND